MPITFRSLALLLGLLLAAGACSRRRSGRGGGDDDDDDRQSDAGGREGEGEGEPGEGEGEGEPGEGEGEDGRGYCTRTCEVAADCCQGLAGCPGEEFPLNWYCDGGFCRSGGCSTDDECTFGGLVQGLECHPWQGLRYCMPVCSGQPDCEEVSPGSSCTGEADDGQRFCESLCQVDDDCEGGGNCDRATGLCGCDDGSDCTDPDTDCQRR